MQRRVDYNRSLVLKALFAESLSAPSLAKTTGYSRPTVDAIISELADDKLIEISKIDLALSTDNDIILDKSGNVALSAGMANLIQALKLKIITPIGSLIKHPSYGFAVPVGINTSAITVDLIKERLFDSIVSDSRFTSANNLNVSIFGPAAIINGSVNVKGLDGILPFSINIS